MTPRAAILPIACLLFAGPAFGAKKAQNAVAPPPEAPPGGRLASGGVLPADSQVFVVTTEKPSRVRVIETRTSRPIGHLVCQAAEPVPATKRTCAAVVEQGIARCQVSAGKGDAPLCALRWVPLK